MLLLEKLEDRMSKWDPATTCIGDIFASVVRLLFIYLFIYYLSIYLFIVFCL